jgi:hypothetical protein
MKRIVLAIVASILAASATVSCDKFKPPVLPPPLPKTDPASPAQQAPALKGQEPGASAVR